MSDDPFQRFAEFHKEWIEYRRPMPYQDFGAFRAQVRSELSRVFLDKFAPIAAAIVVHFGKDCFPRPTIDPPDFDPDKVDARMPECFAGTPNAIQAGQWIVHWACWATDPRRYGRSDPSFKNCMKNWSSSFAFGEKDRPVLRAIHQPMNWVEDAIKLQRRAIVNPQSLTDVEWQLTGLQRAVREVAPSAKSLDDRDKATHSPDFRSVHWFGQAFTFTANQAKCVQLLWKAWEAGTPELSDHYLVTEAELSSDRLRDVFKSNKQMHPAWDTMIQAGTTKGTRRLNNPESHEIPHVAPG